jgi:ATP-dependent RNA helicase DDX46/PRP5
LPKKPAFSAFGASTSSSTSNAAGKGKSKRATAAGMMDEDDSEGKTVLYKPEQGAHIEGGLEPDKPTASQLEAMKRAEAETNGMDVDEQTQEAEEHDESALDDGLDHLDGHDDDDEDDEFKDGGPSVKAAPLSKAQIQALQEEREAEEIEARSRAKAKMDIDNQKADEEEEVDPLDAFMMDVEKEKTKVDKEDLDKLAPSGTSDTKLKTNGTSTSDKKGKKAAGAKGLIDMFEDDSGGESDSEIPDIDDIDKTSLKPEDILALAQKKLKKRDIAPVDHSKMSYEAFRKQFYHPPPEIEEMSNEETEALRVELDNIKIRGVDCPKPITKWSHCGLPAVW